MPSPKFDHEMHVAFALCLLVALSASAKHDKTPLPPASQGGRHYDETRDPAKDLQDTIALATKLDKRILLEVGGDWCVYCNIMDETFNSHPQLRRPATPIS